jgi:hypothetical protein
MRDVRLLAREKVIDAHDVVPLLDEPLAEMRTQKPGPAGDKNAINLRHYC